MKTMYQTTRIMIVMALLAIISCNENDFLEEKPLSIYTPENSLVTVSDFQAAVNRIYRRPADIFFYETNEFAFYYATDLSFSSHDVNKLNKYAAHLIPTSLETTDIWNSMYSIISQANLVLTRLQDADIPEADKKVMRGEALFFRAFGYRILGSMYGGVPLITEEVVEVRRDFVRATREETYTQAKNDLTEAVSLLGNIDAVKDGKISKQMAQHLLSEIYISLGDYDNAISAATAVIDYPAMGLMTERFGTKLDQPGDAYSDLFQTGNINRSSGNRETLWATQYDYLNPAFSGSTDRRSWKYNPQYGTITLTIDGVTTSAFKGITAEKGG
ncbi:MAG: RagB/SusD family nutrient uptake outer membrane protein, partial [Tannerella sp.]|nr:RagB/SusD family nutrient uptake outer membrane protein [Tannerella sp.]